MQTVKAISASLALVLVPSIPAFAQNNPSGQDIRQDFQVLLVATKMAGACGILDSMIQFQETTRLEGGDEFVTRFWSVEAARLGMSVKQLSNQCDQSISAYEMLRNRLGVITR
ncbi:MAG: hypothetical protein FWG52_04320 [Proteobacteria bacterium]|nr:hypothetical protein [Pseudomonadota bacterium]